MGSEPIEELAASRNEFHGSHEIYGLLARFAEFAGFLLRLDAPVGPQP